MPVRPEDSVGAAPSPYASMYAGVQDGPFFIPAVDYARLDPRYLRQMVPFVGYEEPGSIVVDPSRCFLYFVMEGGQAIRYGCGVGKAGFEYEGEAEILRKAEWPRWTPTPDMIAREPEKYAHLTAGMDGGPDNPLGARALYLFRNGEDTLYRIHGSQEAYSIGKAVSSGCVRLINQDVVDLHLRVGIGARVTVLPYGAEDRTAPWMA
jgi:Uncharacterized protein conserved in bacteria